MSKSKVLRLVFLGVLVLLSGIFMVKYNQEKTKDKDTKPTEQTYNPAEHFPNVPFDKDSNYYKNTVPNSDLVYYSILSPGPNTSSNVSTKVNQDKIHQGFIVLSTGYDIYLSLPSGFADLTETAYADEFMYPLHSNMKVQIKVSVFSAQKNCPQDPKFFEVTPTTMSIYKNPIINYNAKIKTTLNADTTGDAVYSNKGLIFQINKPRTSSQNMWSIKNLTLYPCVQIFPNPEDPELKKNHPEIYPEVQEVVKTIVESIRPIN